LPNNILWLHTKQGQAAVLVTNRFNAQFKVLMDKRFTTEEHLTLYYYNEASVYDSIEIEDALDEDTSLQAELEQLETASSFLGQLEIEPPSSVVRSILNYSNSTRLETELY
jgi:hypothetical protein